MQVCYLHSFSQWKLCLGHPDSYKMRYNALAHFHLIQTFTSNDKVNQQFYIPSCMTSHFVFVQTWFQASLFSHLQKTIKSLHN